MWGASNYALPCPGQAIDKVSCLPFSAARSVAEQVLFARLDAGFAFRQRLLQSGAELQPGKPDPEQGDCDE